MITRVLLIKNNEVATQHYKMNMVSFYSFHTCLRNELHSSKPDERRQIIWKKEILDLKYSSL